MISGIPVWNAAEALELASGSIRATQKGVHPPDTLLRQPDFTFLTVPFFDSVKKALRNAKVDLAILKAMSNFWNLMS